MYSDHCDHGVLKILKTTAGESRCALCRASDRRTAEAMKRAETMPDWAVLSSGDYRPDPTPDVDEILSHLLEGSPTMDVMRERMRGILSSV